jgi:hypothetical protein
MQRRIMDAVAEGHSTAGALAGRFAEQNVVVTAWNNRLAALSHKGLLVERALGRTKAYEVVMKGL